MVTDNGVSHYFLWYYLVFPFIGSVLAVLSFKFLLSSK
jgi:glycerol uptake facilitator-like aquaporin